MPFIFGLSWVTASPSALRISRWDIPALVRHTTTENREQRAEERATQHTTHTSPLPPNSFKRASGEAGVNVNAEFDLKVEDDEEDDEGGFFLRIELWDSTDNDEEVGFTQIKAQHTSMPKWLELQNDEGGEF